MPNIDTFRGGFRGSRSNRYLVNTGAAGEGTSISYPNDMQVYIKAVSFPGSQLGMIPVSYQGRIIKFAGERQFAEWSMQVYESDDGFREKMEYWLDEIDGFVSHEQNPYVASAVWTVQMLDGASSVLQTMTLHNPWPIDISPIDLSYEAADSFAEFTLTMAYDYHTIS